MNRYFSLIPVVIIFTTACDQKAPTVESAPRMVKVAQVTAVGNTQQRTFPARIESGDSTELSFKRGGQVESLDIRQGASVAQGQTLARLNAREAQQRVNERQTAATLAQRQFDRFQTLAGRQAISQAEMDVQRANRDAANAALKIAREELAQMSLIAPFSGIAAGVHIRNTAYRPVVRINTLPGREFTAEYKEHTGSSDNSTLTWQIVLTMPRPDDFPAVGGVSGTVTVNLGNLPASAGRETLIVPAEAVFNPDNRPKNEPVVWVVKGDNAHRYLEERKVTVGEVTSQGVAITDGLRAGEQVVAAGVSELHAGQPVRVWTRERGL